MSESPIIQPVSKYDEIELVEIARQLWAGRKIILLTMALFLVAGGLYILYQRLTIVPEYESSVMLYIDSPSPEVLPILISGAPFIAEILKIKIVNQVNQKSETVMEVLNQYQPPQGNNDGLMSRLRVKPGDDGTLQISVLMQDPNLSKQLADSIAQTVGPFLETNRIPRMLKNKNYVTSRYFEAEIAYTQSIKALSDFYHQNAGNLHPIDTITVKRLRAESDLKYEVYCMLAQQLEISKIKEQEQIPICTAIKPATLPFQNNAPRAGKIIFIAILMGIVTGVSWIFGKKFIHKITKIQE